MGLKISNKLLLCIGLIGFSFLLSTNLTYAITDPSDIKDSYDEVSFETKLINNIDNNYKPDSELKGSVVCSPRSAGREFGSSKDVKFKTDKYSNELDNYCFYRDDNSIRFPIYVYINKDAIAGDKVTLELLPYDVDSDYNGPGCGPENDRVEINGHQLSPLTGGTNIWHTNEYTQIPKDWINFLTDNVAYGTNWVEVFRDPQRNQQNQECWAVAVDYGRLKVKAYPIVFIAGMAGTYLFNKNAGLFRDSEAWPQPIESLPDWGDDDHLDVLKLQADGLNPVNPNVIIEAGRPIDSILGLQVYGNLKKFYMTKGIVAEDNIGDFEKSIPANIRTITPVEKDNTRYFEYGYDWRRRLDLVSIGLELKIDKEVLKKTGMDKVVVYAHSMGGLVFRDYHRTNHGKTKLFISMGTPYLGAGKAYGILKYAASFEGFWGIHDDNKISEIAQNFPGMYHLLPAPQYFDRRVYGYLVNDKFDNIPPTGKLALMDTYFNDPQANLSNPNLAHIALNFFNRQVGFENAMEMYLIYGKTKSRNKFADKTIQQFNLKKTLFGNPSFSIIKGAGDETVPEASARPHSSILTGVDGYTLTNYSHTPMVTKPDVMQFTWEKYIGVASRDPQLQFLNFSEVVVDTNNNGLFDMLNISFLVEVEISGDYIIEGVLKDAQEYYTATAQTEQQLAIGSNSVILNFPGYQFTEHEENSSYNLSISTFYNNEFQESQEGLYITNFYNFTQFEPFPNISIEENFNITSINEFVDDVDNDGDYDSLLLMLEANVTLEDDYEIWAFLNISGSIPISFTSNLSHLVDGINNISLKFSSWELSQISNETTFDLSLVIVDSTTNRLLLPGVYRTNLYNSNNFSRRPAIFTEVFSDIGIDTNSNSFFEFLRLQVEVDVVESGEYSIFTSLFTNETNQSRLVTIGTNSTQLSEGKHNISILFDGILINETGVNGPYVFGDLKLYSNESVVDSLPFAGFSNVYNAYQFERSPIIILSVSDYGLDTNNNGLFDFLVVNMQVDANVFDTYSANARLFDLNFSEITFDTDVRSGTKFNLSFQFNGNLIYNNGVNGPYNVGSVIINFGRGGFYIWGDSYTTQIYNYTQFEHEIAQPAFNLSQQWQISNVNNPSSLFTDINNDDKLDIVIVSTNGGFVYLNNGTGFEYNLAFSQNLYPASLGAILSGDVDNDNDLDLIQVGRFDNGRVTVFLNNGTSFIINNEWNQNLPNIEASSDWFTRPSASLGDFNNDGKLDLVLSGREPNASPVRVTKVYRNTGSTFMLQQILRGFSGGAAMFVDVNNDNFLDVIGMGASQTGGTDSRTYINNQDGSFAENVNYALTQMRLSSFATGDIDNDKDMDIIAAGIIDLGSDRETYVYRNTGSGFQIDLIFGQDLIDVFEPQIALGDINNDGRLDIYIAGEPDGPSPQAKGGIYLNNGTKFVFSNPYNRNIENQTGGSTTFGDIDNDNDLDLMLTGMSSLGGQAISKIYLNENTIPNNKPIAPITLNIIQNETTLRFSWFNASDLENPVNGLYYNLRVGTCSSCNDIVSEIFGGAARPTNGYFGNMIQRNEIELNLGVGTYYWNVQTIDGGLLKSNWSIEQVFTLEDVDVATDNGLYNSLSNFSVNEIVYAEFNIVNNANRTLYNISIRFDQNSSDSNIIFDIPFLQQGRRIRQTIPFSYPEEGIYTPQVFIDHLNSILETNESNNLFIFNTIIVGDPLHVILNSSFGTNTDNENLTAYLLGFRNSISNISDWRVNGQSIAKFNLPFDTNVQSGNIRDYTTNNYSGLLYGTTWVPNGKVGGAYSFVGSGDFIEFTTMHTFHERTDATFEFWMYRYDQNSHRSIFWTRENLEDRNRYNFFVHDDATFAFDYRTPPGSVVTIIPPGIVSAPANQWIYIAITRQGNTYKLYKNGVFVTQGIDPNNPPDLPNTNYWKISGRSSNPFNGMVDEVKMYRKVLSPEQIYQNYDAGLLGKQPIEIVAQETNVGETWQVAVTRNNRIEDNTTLLSNELVIVGDPLHVILNSSFGTNTDNENLTAYLLGFRNSISNISDWRVNSQSINVLNMPFDLIVPSGVLRDYSTFGNNGIVNGASWTSMSVVGGAYSFDGINDYISITDSPSLDITQAVTLEAWVKHTGPFRTGYPAFETIIAKGDTTYRLQLCSEIADGCPEVHPINSFMFAVSGSNCNPTDLGSDVIPEENVWYHVVGTYDRIMMRMYVNGEEKSNRSCSGPIATNNWPLSIGENLDFSNRFWNGTIDEVKVYDNALTREQVRMNYLEGLAGRQPLMIVSQETNIGDTWQVAVTRNNRIEDNITLLSNELVISSGLVKSSVIKKSATNIK